MKNNRFANIPNYAVAVTIRRMIDEEYQIAAKAMKAFPGYVDNGAPIPDALKKNPKFMKVWEKVNATISDTKDINEVISKRFKKEKLEDRQKDYAERLLKLNKVT